MAARALAHVEAGTFRFPTSGHSGCVIAEGATGCCGGFHSGALSTSASSSSRVWPAFFQSEKELFELLDQITEIARIVSDR